jgi:hypothetical protein
MTKQIQYAVGKHLSILGHEHICENFGHVIFEMDVASLSRSNMLHEYEVKISRSDFLADKNKMANKNISKFEMYGNPTGHESRCPNYFHYVCPAGMIRKDEVPAFAGLWYYHQDGEIEFIKNGRKIHPIPSSRVDVLGKMLRMTSQRKYLGGTMMTYKNRLIKNRQNAVGETLSDTLNLGDPLQ